MKTFDNICGIYMDLPRALLTTGGVISYLSIGTIFVLFYYYKIPNLRRHPTTIAIHKCWFELIFVTQFLWISAAPHSFFWDRYSEDDSTNCVTNESIWPLAWLVQFTLLGGELWFAVLSLDIHQSLANPFTSYQINAWYYTVGVYAIAGLVATIFVSVVPIQYGLSVDPMIWVNVYNNPSDGRWTKFAIFYVFMIIIYMYCGITAIWARNQIHKGLEETLAVRKYSISKQTRYVIGYFAFWTCVFVLQFLNYLDDAKYDRVGFTNAEDDHIRSASAFLLASRGAWSLGIFLMANWLEISTFFRNQRRGASITAGGRAPPPKEEQEQVQLNVALQTEIVRFTVLGIQRAIKDVDETMAEQERLSGGGAGTSSFFNRRTGDAFSFMISDPEINGSIAQSDATSVANTAGTSASTTAVLDAEAGGLPCDSPLRHLHLATEATARSGGSAYKPDTSPATDTSKDLSFRSGSLFRKSEAVNFALEDDGMIRQDSTSTGSVRSTHVSNNFINQIGSRIRQRLATANRRSMFMFTDYSPKHFAKMREVSGIANEDYLESFKSTTMPSFSEGRSGAFLYFSSDRKYIVKTTTKTEFDKLLQILPQYVEYFVDQISQGHKPLITRFLGAHKIIMYDIPLYFVIMQNICPSVQEKYDLKGSWVNRHSSKKKDYNPKDSRPKKFNIVSGDSHRALNRRQDGAQLFLDNDLQNCFLLDPKVSKYLAEQILRDIKLLAGFNLMDYSLLVGIKRRNFEVIDTAPTTPLTQAAISSHEARIGGGYAGASGLPGQKKNANARAQTPPPTAAAPMSPSGPPANFRDPDGAMHAAVVEGQGTFYIGIIDILQEWNYDKWYERMTKKYILRKDANGLSAMDPLNYRRRFYQRAVLDVFDGLGLEDADDADIFERYSVAAFGGEGGDRDTVDTAISSNRGKERPTMDNIPPPPATATSPFALAFHAKDQLSRDTEASMSESGSSAGREVQLQSFNNSHNNSRDSSSYNPNSPLGADKRFQVKPILR